MRTHVRRIAERMHASLPSQVELDDLVQQGYLGLVDSIEDIEIFNHFRQDGQLNEHAEYGYLINKIAAEIVANWWRGARRALGPLRSIGS